MADKHFTYGRGSSNSNLACWLYDKPCPNRWSSSKETFPPRHEHLLERGTFQNGTTDCGVTRHIRTPNVEENVLDNTDEHPEHNILMLRKTPWATIIFVSCRVSADSHWFSTTDIFLSIVSYMIMSQLHVLYLLMRQNFRKIRLKKTIMYINGPTETLMLLNNVDINKHLHDERTGIVGDCLTGPKFLPDTLTIKSYRQFLEH